MYNDGSKKYCTGELFAKPMTGKELRTVTNREFSEGRRQLKEQITLSRILDIVESLDDRVEKLENAFNEKFCMMDDPSPELLEQYDMLRNIYDQYKAAEALLKEIDHDNKK